MEPIVLGPGEGEVFDMGRLGATWKAETDAYSISEWWIDPGTAGPGQHQHPDDDIFFVLPGGPLHVCVDGEWHEAQPGSFVRVPGGVLHDFENRGTERAGFLNVASPGGFLTNIPGIAEWFRERDGFAPA